MSVVQAAVCTNRTPVRFLRVEGSCDVFWEDNLRLGTTVLIFGDALWLYEKLLYFTISRYSRQVFPNCCDNYLLKLKLIHKANANILFGQVTW